MSSSFDFLDLHAPKAARRARSAETFAHGQPEIALFRLRQFAECVVSAVGRERGVTLVEKLADNIEVLARKDAVTDEVKAKLRQLKEFGNAAVHPESDLGRKHAKQLGRHALSCLGVAFDLGAWLVGDVLDGERPAEDYEAPERKTAPSKAEKRIVELQMILERADDDARSDGLDAAEAQCTEVVDELSDKQKTKGFPTVSKGLLRLRAESILRAVANHRGETIPFLPDKFAASYRELLESGDNEAFERVCELGNRFAVAEFNAFRFMGAADWLSKLIEGWRGRHELARVLYGDADVKDYFLGTLYGSRGQAHAFLAHALDDPSGLVDAVADFGRAEQLFTESGDRTRQRVYLAHAALEAVRLGSAEDVSEHASAFSFLEDKAAQAARALVDANDIKKKDFADLFVLDVVLKKHDLFRESAPSWARDLAALLARTVIADEPLGHPYEHLCGRLWLLLGGDCPVAVREAVKRTGAPQGEAQDLVAFIAHTFVLEEAFRRTGHIADEAKAAHLAARPRSLIEQWDAYDYGVRFDTLCEDGGAGPLRILPFNYA